MTNVRIAVLGSCAMALGLVALSVSAAEGGDRLRAHLNGFHEVPGNFTAGHGEFDARISDDESAIVFTLTYADLSGPPMAAHIHFGQPRTNGGVSFFFCGGGGKPACPDTPSGTITGTVTAADVVGPAAQGIDPGNLAAIIAAIRHGSGYANMHTAKFPAGEIRGQVHVGGRDADD
jgi:hypothetical protein